MYMCSSAYSSLLFFLSYPEYTAQNGHASRIVFALIYLIATFWESDLDFISASISRILHDSLWSLRSPARGQAEATTRHLAKPNSFPTSRGHHNHVGGYVRGAEDAADLGHHAVIDSGKGKFPRHPSPRRGLLTAKLHSGAKRGARRHCTLQRRPASHLKRSTSTGQSPTSTCHVVVTPTSLNNGPLNR